MSRVYNFSAGPAVLPEEVLKEAAAEMLDYNGTGMSVMEMSHRSRAFEEIIETAKQDLRDLLGIPEQYKVLFLQGGAHQQFAAVPLNLMKNRVGDYIITGQWAKKAWKEAKLYGTANVLAAVRTKISAIFRTAPIFLWMKRQIMSTSAKIIPSMGRNTARFPIPRESPLYQMSLPVSFLNPWM